MISQENPQQLLSGNKRKKIRGVLIMKKILLKFKILFTNVSRVIMSFLFININFSFINKVFGIAIKPPSAPTCYDLGPVKKVKWYETDKIFLLFIPTLLIVLLLSFLFDKAKKSNNEKLYKIMKILLTIIVVFAIISMTIIIVTYLSNKL